MKYKLIAVDIDGTLLSPNRDISVKNYSVLKNATENGIIVALCTGRSYFMAAKVIGDLDFEFPLVLHNGAMIVNSRDGSLLKQWALSPETARQAVTMMKGFGLEAFAYHFREGECRVAYESINPANKAYAGYMSTKESLLYQTPDLAAYLDHSTTQLVAIDHRPIIDKAMEVLKKSLPGANIFTSGSLGGEYWFLEVLDIAASKSKSVAYLAQRHQIKQSEIMAIGDNFNDLDLIEYAGLGIAMANAPVEVEAQADFVTASNADDGVAKAVEKFVYYQ